MPDTNDYPFSRENLNNDTEEYFRRAFKKLEDTITGNKLKEESGVGSASFEVQQGDTDRTLSDSLLFSALVAEDLFVQPILESFKEDSDSAEDILVEAIEPIGGRFGDEVTASERRVLRALITDQLSGNIDLNSEANLCDETDLLANASLVAKKVKATRQGDTDPVHKILAAFRKADIEQAVADKEQKERENLRRRKSDKTDIPKYKNL